MHVIFYYLLPALSNPLWQGRILGVVSGQAGFKFQIFLTFLISFKKQTFLTEITKNMPDRYNYINLSLSEGQKPLKM